VESIALLAERLPEDRVEHNYADLPTVADPDAVQRSDEPVGEIARQIETNGCWMVLKNIERDAEYKALLDETLDEVAPLVDDRDGGMLERRGFVFLSAPGSVTPSHTDPEHNFLLQVRGTKDMNVGRFPDKTTEQLALEHALGGGHRNVDWEPEEPRTFALDPGSGVYVPPHAPHWVKNGESVSVSLSITFQTATNERAMRVHSMNAKLRRVGLSPRPPGQSPRTDRRKAACAKALGRIRRLV
jgi:cupin superfamily protein